jgi:hypothetical protein
MPPYRGILPRGNYRQSANGPPRRAESSSDLSQRSSASAKTLTFSRNRVAIDDRWRITVPSVGEFSRERERERERELAQIMIRPLYPGNFPGVRAAFR